MRRYIKLKEKRRREDKHNILINTVSSLLSQVISIVCGFVLPRLILSNFGSEVNGLVSSITQFLGFISLMQLGVGAVVQTAWYKPLAQKNMVEVSKIYISAERFFRRIALIFVAYTIALAIVFPIKIGEFDYWFTATLVLAISISLFIQYYYGLTNQMLLYADGKAYLYLFCQTGTVLLNLILCVILIQCSASIHVVKLVSSLVFAITPIILHLYVFSRYKIDRRIVLHEEPIKQKWNGFAQHLSSVVMDNTDVVVLTLFSSLSNVSVYSVYHLVVFGVRQIVTSMTVGIQSAFGNLIATKDKSVKDKFIKTEVAFHCGVTVIFACVLVLIGPFVEVYTRDITDADYIQPLFGYLISIAFALYCYRLPYYAIIKAAGHYKETQTSAIIEMILNIGVSVVVVINYGLVGVAVGTLIATLYRSIYFVFYVQKKIIPKPIGTFLKLLLADCIVFCLAVMITGNFVMGAVNYWEWVILAVKVFLTVLVCSAIVYVVTNMDLIKKKGHIDVS